MTTQSITASMQLESLLIRSAMGDYRVDFWRSLELAIASLTDPKGCFLIMDRKVEALYRTRLASLANRYPTFLLDADENTKTLDGVAKLSTWLQENGANKRSRLIAVGGGIIQDICAFTAHVFYRGIPWVFFPTTLLSMCDSCIGAKSSINHAKAKNQLGAFHSPIQVHIVPDFLTTLDERDLKSGYGEILKLMLTESLTDFERFENQLSETQTLLASWLPSLIRRSLEIKKAIIEVDELERDLRRILNFGHTFGHAIETLSNYEVPHGLAVAWGIDLVNYIAVRRNLLDAATAARVRALIRRHLSISTQYKLHAERLIAGIRSDKKAETDHVNLILLHAQPFGLKVVKQAYDPELKSWLEEYVRDCRLFSPLQP